MIDRMKLMIDKTWPEAYRVPPLPKKAKIIPIKILQEKLIELRGRLGTTRPLCPTETRPFTYQKEKKEIKMDKKGKPVLTKSGKPTYKPTLAPNGVDHLYEWVTEPSTVTLRRFGIPKAEEICHELGQQICEVKQLVIEQGYDPIDYDMSIPRWEAKMKEEEEADAKAKLEAENELH